MTRAKYCRHCRQPLEDAARVGRACSFGCAVELGEVPAGLRVLLYHEPSVYTVQSASGASLGCRLKLVADPADEGVLEVRAFEVREVVR